jgi:hypothetical protein
MKDEAVAIIHWVVMPWEGMAASCEVVGNDFAEADAD